MTELRCSRHTSRNPLVCISLDDGATARLAAAQKAYGDMTGKRLTRSVIMRRALSLLAEHLRGVDTATKREREVTALLLAR